MKTIFQLLIIAFFSKSAYSQEITDTTSLRQSLEKRLQQLEVLLKKAMQLW